MSHACQGFSLGLKVWVGVLGFGFWVLGSGFWVLGFWVCLTRSFSGPGEARAADALRDVACPDGGGRPRGAGGACGRLRREPRVCCRRAWGAGFGAGGGFGGAGGAGGAGFTVGRGGVAREACAVHRLVAPLPREGEGRAAEARLGPRGPRDCRVFVWTAERACPGAWFLGIGF